MRRLVDELRPVAGRLFRALLSRLGSLALRAAERRSARAVAGFPVVMACLAGAGVRGWVIALMAVEALVVLGFWSGGLWWVRRFDTVNVFGSDTAGDEASSGRPARQPEKEVVDGIQAAAGDRAAGLGGFLDVG